MPSDLAARFARLPTAAVLDGAQARAVYVGRAITAVWPGAALAGPAFTVRTRPGDNRPVHLAIADAPCGAVVVVAVDAQTDHAIFGDLLARVGAARGLAGLVTDGAVRDVGGIAAAPFPVFAAGVTLRAPVKEAAGEYGVPVAIGAATVTPGDWVVADADGVVVVSGDHAEAVAEAAEAVERREAAIVAGAAAGTPTPDQLGLR
jgi:regulator of RNase E activity RraA